MSPDLQELEANLKGLHPAALDEVLLARLVESTHGSLTTLNPEEVQFEALLRRIRPAAVPPALMATLETARRVSAATSEPAIIPFPQAATAPASRSRHGSRQMFAAAAAVALLGAAAALFMPGKSPQQTVAAPISHPPIVAPFSTAPASPATQSSQNYVPATFNTGLSQAKDEGVLWQSTDQPRRVVKVVYWDRVTLVNPEGKKIECEQPRVEYILVPEKID